MIVIYPMLTSGSVSPNILPGVIKAMEKYILLYNTDEVLKLAGGSTAGKILSTGAGMLKVGATLAASKDNSGKGETLTEQPPRSITKTPQQRPSTSVNVSTPKPSTSGVRPSLDIPRGDAISLEPTWMSVTTAKKGLQILGVKVVPFKVKSGESMATLLVHDSQMRNLSYLSKKYGRAVSRVFFRLMRKIRVPMIKDKALSGDPQKDIIYGATQYGKNMLVCLSQLDLENEEFFESPAGVQRLHKLGWVSFAIVDDVNKKATFCMKEFGGVCSIVPYGYIFSSLGREHSKVYEDLEDLKKTSGPFFNMRTNRRRAFTEGNLSQLDSYLKLIQE